MKILSIDFGEKRVGLAMSNPEGTLAFAYKTLYKTSREALFEELLEIIREERIEALALGLPVHHAELVRLQESDEPPLIIRQIRNFANKLKHRAQLPLYFVDESMSSEEAREILLERGLRGERLKKALDQQAAVLILETFFNAGDPGCFESI